MPVKLPTCFETHNLIKQMKIGQDGYTVPWAMQVDSNRECWIDPEFTVHTKSGGTVSMWIKRYHDGFVVHPAHDYTWEPEGAPSGYLPVIEFL